MASLMTYQGIVFAMAISAGSLILFDLFKDRNRFLSEDPLPALKSCLSSSSSSSSSSGSGCGSGGNKKKKKVKFAEDVRESRGDGEAYRRRRRRNQGPGDGYGEEDAELSKKEIMPANHMALYSGILRDRFQFHRRSQFSY